MLRSRYKPEWRPSWEGTDKQWFQCEDGLRMGPHPILDATRISDGKMVAIKAVCKSVHPLEVEITQFFSSEPVSSDLRNHCTPLYDVLQDPYDGDTSLLVLPLLRQYDDPRFQTVGEAVEFFRQLFQGLEFMHEHRVAHRDCMSLNIMMDPLPMFPNMYHPQSPDSSLDLRGFPKQYTRTERPTKYYLVDFGLSRKYAAYNVTPQELPILGGDKSVPEFQGEGHNEAWDPFPTDVYYIGNVIREGFLQKYYGLDFMDGLVKDMLSEDPSQRPTMTAVVARFEDIRAALTSRTMRRRLIDRREDGAAKLFLSIWHVFRSARYIVRRLPARPAVDRADFVPTRS